LHLLRHRKNAKKLAKIAKLSFGRHSALMRLLPAATRNRLCCRLRRGAHAGVSALEIGVIDGQTNHFECFIHSEHETWMEAHWGFNSLAAIQPAGVAAARAERKTGNDINGSFRNTTGS
jgi:hypothetical protein